MKKLKIILTFIYCSAGNLVKLTRRILDSLKGNAQFPNPTPALTDVEKKLEEYMASLSAAGGRDREKVAIKDNRQAELRQLLTELAHYVTQTCKGDKAMLLSSGFDISPEKSSPQKAPPKLQAEMAMPGQVTTRVKRVTKARAYVHQITNDPLTPQSVWTSETTLMPEHTFTGLTSASKVWLRVIVIDRSGKQIVWEPVARIVQ
jgi:hypothetical protein